MYNALLLGAALFVGQAQVPSPQPAQIMPPLVVHRDAKVVHVSSPVTSVVQTSHNGDKCAPSCNNSCDNSCDRGCCAIRGFFSHCCCDCNITCLKPWKCEDLECKPAECVKTCCGWRCIFFCPKEDEGCNGNGHANGNGEKKEEAKNGKNGKNGEEKKNGNGKEEEAEEEPDLNPAMQLFQCKFPHLFNHMQCNGTKIYGWVQGGYTANFDSPNDRVNFGVNWNDRSNDFLLNQLYFVLERPLDLDKKVNDFHMGFRFDLMFGHDAPNFANFALGFTDGVTGNSNVSPLTTEFGYDVPQFYLDFHLPVLTERGVDVRIGRFYTLMGYELTPAPLTDFYSHSYEYFHTVPFTQAGAMVTAHLGDSVDFHTCIIRGWEVVFDDANDALEYMGGLTWTSCSKNDILALAWVIGPEQIGKGPNAVAGANQNYRSVATAYWTHKFGRCNQWRFVTGGSAGFEENAVNGNTQDAEWYGYTNYLFYTVDPRLTLGARAEWFRDDDGARTAYLGRPGFDTNFFEVTLGATWRPYQNLRLRPEIRFDWSDGRRPYNDQQDNFMTTFAMDFIWEF